MKNINNQAITILAQIRIHHSKLGINTWDIKEWPERYIEHDEKKLLSETKSITDLYNGK